MPWRKDCIRLRGLRLAQGRPSAARRPDPGHAHPPHHPIQVGSQHNLAGNRPRSRTSSVRFAKDILIPERHSALRSLTPYTA